jgi:hypothetical protein
MNNFVPSAISCGGEVIASINCGIVNEDIDATPFLDSSSSVSSSHADRSRNLRLNPATVILDLLNCRLSEIIPTAIIECHVCLHDENLTKCCTDAARSACNKRSLSFQQKTHLVIFLLKIR